jgi:hypothetical protein
MTPLNLADVSNYVEQNIGTFHKKRLDKAKAIQLGKVLKTKNPYMFKAKNILTAEEFIKSIVDAYISSSEETIFGDWFEALAIYINGLVYNGSKSGIKGVDLEFEKNNIHYIVNIKSGPNWGNASQIGDMINSFNSAKRTFRTSGGKMSIVAINGCCYGIDNNPDKGEYHKLCGQRFWEFISETPDLYKDLIVPLSHEAEIKNEEFREAYSALINKFTNEFYTAFCSNPTKIGAIDWDQLVKFNSGQTGPAILPV